MVGFFSFTCCPCIQNVVAPTFWIQSDIQSSVGSYNLTNDSSMGEMVLFVATYSLDTLWSFVFAIWRHGDQFKDDLKKKWLSVQIFQNLCQFFKSEIYVNFFNYDNFLTLDFVVLVLVDGDKQIVLSRYSENKFISIVSKHEVRYVVFGTFLIYIDNEIYRQNLRIHYAEIQVTSTKRS